MSNPVISIIVPVYNVEHYLVRCLKSVQASRFYQWECILIDDGSTDSSCDICNAFRAIDQRFIVVHKSNGGVSSARNVGLALAKGTWVAFIDSDDYIDEDFLTVPHVFSNCDVVEKGYFMERETTQHSQAHAVGSEQIMTAKDDMLRYFVNKRQNALWNKLLKRSLIGQHTFDTTISIGEDFMFFLSVLSSISSWGFSPAGNYHYIMHENSAMTNINHKPKDRLRVIEENVLHIENILSETSQRPLKDSIIYKTYIGYLLSHKRILTPSQRTLLKRLISQYSWSAASLVQTQNRLKIWCRMNVAKLILEISKK